MPDEVSDETLDCEFCAKPQKNKLELEKHIAQYHIETFDSSDEEASKKSNEAVPDEVSDEICEVEDAEKRDTKSAIKCQKVSYGKIKVKLPSSFKKTKLALHSYSAETAEMQLVSKEIVDANDLSVEGIVTSKYSCKVLHCNKSFESLSTYKQHMDDEHVIESDSESIQIDLNSSDFSSSDSSVGYSEFEESDSNDSETSSSDEELSNQSGGAFIDILDKENSKIVLWSKNEAQKKFGASKIDNFSILCQFCAKPQKNKLELEKHVGQCHIETFNSSDEDDSKRSNEAVTDQGNLLRGIDNCLGVACFFCASS